MIAESQQSGGDPDGSRHDVDFGASASHLSAAGSDGFERSIQGTGQGTGTHGGPVRGPTSLNGSTLNVVGTGVVGPGVANGTAALSVGLVDCYRFSQEALVKAFEGMQARLAVTAFTTVSECIAGAPGDWDIVVYYAHVGGSSDAVVAADLAALRQGLKGIPLIVMSDAEDAQQPDSIRNALRSGARGFIPTRTMGIPLTLAVLRFVQAGGTYAPLDRLLDDPAEAVPAVAEVTPTDRFTSRQITVLMHLKQGKANKTIAHELGMSESTVKVHVRNIMRTMGATNRTQAAYKAQQMWRGAGQTPACDQ